MIDLCEHLMTVRDAARLFPGRNGRPINISTLWRWMLDGRRGVRLESLIIGGTKYTSREALQRFVERLNPAQAAAPALRTTAQRARASERAARQLKKFGI